MPQRTDVAGSGPYDHDVDWVSPGYARAIVNDWQRWAPQLLIAVGAGLLLWGVAHLLMTASDRRQYDVTLEDRRAEGMP